MRALPRIRFTRLGARIVVFFVALLILVQGITAYLVLRTNSQIARATIDQQLAQGERVFRSQLSQSQARLEQGAAILSADFAFRQAIATNNAGTIESVLRNHGARLGANVMMLVSLDGQVVADTQDPARVGKPFTYPSLIEASVSAGKSSAIVLLGDRLHQLVVVPVLAPEPIAHVGLAFEVDDAVARELRQVTGLEVSFLTRQAPNPWRIHASTLDNSLRGALAGSLAENAEGSPFRPVVLDGEEYETRASSLRSMDGIEIVAALQKPLAVGLAPFQTISTWFFILTIAGLALLVAGSLVIARGITSPVSTLAAAARRVQEGDYTRPVQLARHDEIGQLADSFNHMLDGLVSREREILRLA